MGEEVVEGIFGEVDGDVCAVFLGYGADEKVVAEEELKVDGGGVEIFWIVEEQGVEEGETRLGLLVEGSVDVVQETVAGGDGVLGCLGDHWPLVELLGNGIEAVVVPGLAVLASSQKQVDGTERLVIPEEGVESTQPCPARAQCLGGVITETADISADHRNLEDRGELENAANGVLVMVPCGQIVSKPFANVCASSSILQGESELDSRRRRKYLTVERVMTSGRRSGLRASRA